MHSTVTTKINFEGDTAVSVTVVGTQNGNEATLKAKKEIIIGVKILSDLKVNPILRSILLYVDSQQLQRHIC